MYEFGFIRIGLYFFLNIALSHSFPGIQNETKVILSSTPQGLPFKLLFCSFFLKIEVGFLLSLYGDGFWTGKYYFLFVIMLRQAYFVEESVLGLK